MLQELGALLEEKLEKEHASDRLLEECFRELAANQVLRGIVADDFTRLIPAQQAVLTAACHHEDGIDEASLATTTGHDPKEIDVAARTLAHFGYVHRGDPVRLRFCFYRQMLPSTASQVDPKKLMRLVDRRVFVSYARKDAEWLERLKRFLDPVISDNVDIWDDQRIQPGESWREEIDRSLEESQVALLLISSDFLASRFISEVELPALLSGNRRVLCLHVRPSALADIPRGAPEPLHLLAEFQALNDPKRPLSTLVEPEWEKLLVSITAQISRSLYQAPL